MDLPVNEIITGIVSIVGSGGLVTLINSRQQNRKDERSALNTLMVDRIKMLEDRDKECNTRVSDLERKNWELEREALKMIDRVSALESGNVTAIVSADTEMRVLTWNTGAVLLFGYLETEMLGKNVDVLVPGHLKQQHHDAYERAVNDLDAVTLWKEPKELLAVHKDGRYIPVNLTVTSFTNADGVKTFEARINKIK